MLEPSIELNRIINRLTTRIILHLCFYIFARLDRLPYHAYTVYLDQFVFGFVINGQWSKIPWSHLVTVELSTNFIHLVLAL